MIRHDKFEKLGLIDYNFQCFTAAITELLRPPQKETEPPF
jgi:hypothetical protein